ncbi:MAG: TRAP transporter small permease [Spirochaetales bacterium]|nr:TRAP transporter small permease [Spirochaetales bacterium]
MVKKILDIIEKILMVIMGILLGVMTAIIFYQVFLRYAFSSANPWADELARYAMIWAIMLAAPVGFRKYRHIRIDVFIRYVSEKPRKIIDLFMYILELAFLVVMLCAGISICGKVARQVSVGLGLPIPIMYMSVAVSAGLSIVFILENIFNEYFMGFIAARKSKGATQ